MFSTDYDDILAHEGALEAKTADIKHPVLMSWALLTDG